MLISAISFVILIFTTSCAKTSLRIEDPDLLGKMEKADGVPVSKEVFSKDDYAEPAAGAPTGIAEESETVPMGMVEGKDPKLFTVKEKRGKMRGGSYQQASGLRAGYADDNRQFSYFIDFLKKYGPIVAHYPINIEERILLRVKDKNGEFIPNAEIKVYSGKKLLSNGTTFSDGSFLFFPSEYDDEIVNFRSEVTSGQSKKEIFFERNGKREVEVILDTERRIAQNIPFDILFVLDTTGSMGEEINRLKKTIEIIHMNLVSMPLRPVLRFGIVLYKDKYDQYVTKTVPLTDNIDHFRRELKEATPSGGGDGPEDLQSALKAAVKNIRWNRTGIRLVFVITDAPPHLDYGQVYTYVDAARDSKREGIKIFSVGAGGLNISGEFVLRQISQYTSGRYIFLTYGEQGESEGGRPGSVSHHTGGNFKADKLETIIIGFAKEELTNILGEEIADDDYFVAVKNDDESSGETIKKLFDMAISQLVDYSSYKLAEATPAVVFPVTFRGSAVADNAEYFSEQLALSLSRNKAFNMVERKDLQAIMDETKFQLSGFVSEDEAAEVGGMTGAKVIITGNMYEKRENYELFLKLLRVKTGEVLSITKALINKKLGLACRKSGKTLMRYPALIGLPLSAGIKAQRDD